jgi:hypothetical protein
MARMVPSRSPESRGDSWRYAAAPVISTIAPASEMKSRSASRSSPRKRWNSMPPITPIASVITAHSTAVGERISSGAGT